MPPHANPPFAIQNFAQAFKTVGSGHSGKVILDWGTLQRAHLASRP
jgi:hypothetical protein